MQAASRTYHKEAELAEERARWRRQATLAAAAKPAPVCRRPPPHYPLAILYKAIANSH